MKISKGVEEDGIVVGNTYDKYGSKNPVVKRIMQGFSDAISSLVELANPGTIHEIGCGEGYWVLDWNRQGIKTRGSDFSDKVIEMAQANAVDQGLPKDLFNARSIYDMKKEADGADLVVCCEVMEHLEYPENGLQKIQEVAEDYVLLSVPREPLWRALNLVRGKYVGSLGNTPGHIQHWSKRKFLRLVEQYFDLVEVRTPLPWTMVLCRKKKNNS